MSGNAISNQEGAAFNLKVYGTATLRRIRAKKSADYGLFAFNVDTSASQASKYIPAAECLVDINPAALIGQLSDSDTIVDIPNWVDGSSIVAATGDAPEWLENGDYITSFPSIDFTSNGGDERLTLASPVPSFAAGEPFSIAVVVDNGNNNNKPAIGSDVGSGTYASKYGTGSNRNTMIQDESGNSHESTAGSTTHFKNKDIHTAVRLANNRVSCWRRGVNIINGGSLSGTFSPSIIGNARQGSSWSGQNANFTRILISEDAWSDSEREDIEAWLAWEYGVQTTNNSYLQNTHVGWRSDPRITKTAAFSSDIDLTSLAKDTWSSYFAPPSTWAVNGPLAIYPTKAYKAGTITLEIDFTV